jgi:SAM-dependent methyltransferase
MDADAQANSGSAPLAQLPFPTRAVRSFDEFRRLEAASARELDQRRLIEGALVTAETFLVEGSCGICRRPSSFWVDFEYAFPDAPGVPNWRERLCCVSCNLNNRMRAALHYLDQSLPNGGAVYITEQTTLLYEMLADRYPGAVGSEFVCDGTARGEANAAGLRFEDVTDLSFASASLDAILTFDVLEHVPDYERAIAEFARCLRPGGHLIMTVPFALSSPTTITRARLKPDGSVEHLLPPEIHGDPLSNDGILAYYNFGWDLLDRVREAGFADVAAHFYWSLELAYLGGMQFLFHARR